jgi:hypothetical protein
MQSPSTYKRPLDRPVLDWKELTLGETVVIVNRRGLHSTATVDTISDEGNLVWLVPQNLGHRTLYLRTDPIMLHRTS